MTLNWPSTSCNANRDRTGGAPRIVRSLHVNGTGNWFDQALDVAIDPAGNSIAVGNLVNRGAGSDFTVVQFPGGNPCRFV